jgi:hypothetical protein
LAGLEPLVADVVPTSLDNGRRSPKKLSAPSSLGS